MHRTFDREGIGDRNTDVEIPRPAANSAALDIIGIDAPLGQFVAILRKYDRKTVSYR
jgi:hypothetical protein